MLTVSPPSAQAKYWQWRGHQIRYQQAGSQGPAVVLLHGFGASSDHWHNNLPVLTGRELTVRAKP